jgi:organic radical activating enzyme
MVQQLMISDQLHTQYEVVGTIDLGQWTDDYETSVKWLHDSCQQLYQTVYKENQRIVFLHTHDYYVKDSDPVGIILKNVQVALNATDISNYFCVISSTNPEIAEEMQTIKSLSTDPVQVKFEQQSGQFRRINLDYYPYSKQEHYQYGSANPIKIKLNDLDAQQQFLLTESRTFCMYPWVHLHAWPTGEAYPCCHAEMGVGQVGNCRTSTLEEIWTGVPMQRLRADMLNETPNAACGRCYEQEKSGFFSGRQSANKHHGHHIKKLDANPFEMTYWDIRFSNLCNLKCRSCGHIFSSQWYQDQVKLAGPDWKARNTVLNYAGRTETDMWEQLIPHLDYVEQIYFAGGEPLLMEEHYRILDELVRRKRFDVRLIYNTNFTHTDLKGRSVFDYWKQFKSVAVGASLDGQGQHGEYIRKGTDWAGVEQNRKDMLATCPEVDFYISPTLSIMNALHLPDFHRDWVAKGLLKAQDLNVNILQDPAYFRIDIAPAEYKEKIKHKLEQHLEWLRPLDHLKRATVGFESAIKFMMSTDNTHLIDTFWRKTNELDAIRTENILDTIPELAALK